MLFLNPKLPFFSNPKIYPYACTILSVHCTESTVQGKDGDEWNSQVDNEKELSVGQREMSQAKHML